MPPPLILSAAAKICFRLVRPSVLTVRACGARAILRPACSRLLPVYRYIIVLKADEVGLCTTHSLPLGAGVGFDADSTSSNCRQTVCWLTKMIFNRERQREREFIYHIHTKNILL